MIDTIKATSLAEVNAAASMMHRVDRKYILSAKQFHRVLASLGSSLRVLEIDGKRTFSYQSEYFDTADLVSYCDAAYHRRRRFKIRVRCYCDCDTSWIEVKTPGDRGITRKDRIPVPKGINVEETCESFAQEILPQRVGLNLEASLLPTLTTCYDRSTFLMPGNEGRVTLDRYLLMRTTKESAYLPSQVVLETKSATGRTWVDRQLWSMGMRPMRMSKYATGMALTHQGLPCNRWSKTMRLLQIENRVGIA